MIKKNYWLITGGVAVSIITGIALASILPAHLSNIWSKPTGSLQNQLLSSPTNQPSQGKIAEKSNLDDSSHHHRLDLQDRIRPGSNFDRFRKRLRQAVRSRDANLIRSIASPQIRLSFNSSRTLDDLDLNNPRAPIWLAMEKAFAGGCNKQTHNGKKPTWICPQVGAIWPQQLDPQHYVAIIGENVNVRDRPNHNSQIIGILSNEAVELDQTALKKTPVNFNNLNDWTPIILPNKQHGYIANNYVYSAYGYHGFFEKIGGKWKMTTFQSGK